METLRLAREVGGHDLGRLLRSTAASVKGRLSSSHGERGTSTQPDVSGPSRSPRTIDAERFLATVEADKLRGTYVDPSAGRVTFGEYAEQWRTMQVHRPSTQAYVETMLRRHAVPHFGAMALANVRPSHVQAGYAD